MHGDEYLALLVLLWPICGMVYYLTCFKYRKDDSLSRNSLNSSNHKTEAVTIRGDDVDVTINADVHNPVNSNSEGIMNEKNTKEVKNIKV